MYSVLIRISLLLFISFNSLGQDKLYHAIAGVGIGYFHSTVIYHITEDPDKTFLIASLSVVEIAALKEGLDALGDGTPELLDFAATVAPGVLVSYLLTRAYKKSPKVTVVPYTDFKTAYVGINWRIPDKRGKLRLN